LSFPVAIKDNEWGTASGEDKIELSIWIILTTPVMLRFGQPDFGSMLPYMVFETYNETLRQELALYVRTALERWETRIAVLDVVIDDSEIGDNKLHLMIAYVIRGVTKESRFRIPIQLENTQQTFQPSATFTVSGNRILR
jgi:phage baseplate assembly protein W